MIWVYGYLRNRASISCRSHSAVPRFVPPYLVSWPRCAAPYTLCIVSTRSLCGALPPTMYVTASLVSTNTGGTSFIPLPLHLIGALVVITHPDIVNPCHGATTLGAVALHPAPLIMRYHLRHAYHHTASATTHTRPFQLHTCHTSGHVRPAICIHSPF